jgi:hypothetical protein
VHKLDHEKALSACPGGALGLRLSCDKGTSSSGRGAGASGGRLAWHPGHWQATAPSFLPVGHGWSKLKLAAD